MTTIDIPNWLASISPTVHQFSTSHREAKRRKLHRESPSPPTNDTDVIMVRSRTKRTRETDETSEASEPESKRRPNMRSGDISSERSASQASSRQSRPPPNDLAIEARLHTNGYEFVAFGDPKRQLPAALRQLVNELRCIQTSKASKIFEFMDNNEDRDELLYMGFTEAAFCPINQPPTSPFPPTLCTKAIEQSHRCVVDIDEEASWNYEVHGKVLEQVFREEQDPGQPLVSDFRYCPNSNMDRIYSRRVPTPSKVDFYIMLPMDDTEQHVMESICKSKNFRMNHMRTATVCKHPVAIPIKTKVSSGDKDEGWHQLANLQTAQWLWLCRESRPELTFLLGILVNKSKWYLSALVPHQDRLSTFFFGLPLGGTVDTAQMYRLLLSLRKVREWAEKVYLPAMKKHIFDISE